MRETDALELLTRSEGGRLQNSASHEHLELPFFFTPIPSCSTFACGIKLVEIKHLLPKYTEGIIPITFILQRPKLSVLIIDPMDMYRAARKRSPAGSVGGSSVCERQDSRDVEDSVMGGEQHLLLF